jgi:excisionase family DNA binding protein
MTSDPNRLLTEDEAADYLRVRPRTLQRWRQLGRGPTFTRAGRRILYRMADLEQYLREQERPPEPPGE